MAIKVSIYDDNLARRESLSMLILSDPAFSLSGSYPDCSQILENTNQSKPDVILMDIQMPKVDGIKGVQILKSNFPEIAVVMQTVFEDDEKVFESLLNGASGYILKKTPPEKIVEAIKDVHNGGSPITPSIASKVLRFFSEMQKPTAEIEVREFDLTAREKEILSFLVSGLSYKMIADKCSISVYTVNAHIRKIYEKLHVHSATEALAVANQHKLINPTK